MEIAVRVPRAGRELAVSGGEVNGLSSKGLLERFPPVDFPHEDLAGPE